MVSLSSLQILGAAGACALPGDKKTQPEEQPSRERFGPTTLLLPEGYSAFR